MRFTVDAIAGLAFGADVNTLESDDEVIQRHLDKIFPALFKRVFALVPWWRWFPRAADRELEGCDFIRVGDDGLVHELVVMIRPHSGLQSVMGAMGRLLGR